jgi:hypothetical protein
VRVCAREGGLLPHLSTLPGRASLTTVAIAFWPTFLVLPVASGSGFVSMKQSARIAISLCEKCSEGREETSKERERHMLVCNKDQQQGYQQTKEIHGGARLTPHL